MFECESGTDDAQRRNDLMGFVVSKDLEPLLDSSNVEALQLLLKFLRLFDDATFARAFNDRRLDCLLEQIDTNNWRDKEIINLLLEELAFLSDHFPAFAQRLSGGSGFVHILDTINDNFSEDVVLSSNIVRVCDSIFGPESDMTRTAGQQLFASGVSKLCCTLLKKVVLSSNDPEMKPVTVCMSADDLALLLCVLRKAMNASVIFLDPAASDDKVAPLNSAVAMFMASRGPQALEILQYHVCVQDYDGGNARHELLQLQSLLVSMAVITPDTVVTEDVRTNSFAEMREFLQQRSSWQKAFDAHIACSLENCGFPPRLSRKKPAEIQQPASVPEHQTNISPPSPAALALLQAMARERILVYSGELLTSQHVKSDVIMTLHLYNSMSLIQDRYSMVIRLNDERFPCNAAHFRAAAGNGIGNSLHTCYVPQGQTAASSQPFVTFYNSRFANLDVSCAPAPLSLPGSEIVYGEFAETADAGAAESATYPVGTVMMYPRAILPTETYDTPWLIIFKPCPVSVLRGAVPVGRVMSCVATTQPPAQQDGETSPFDTVVLQRFETRCQSESCSNGSRLARVAVCHAGFAPQ